MLGTRRRGSKKARILLGLIRTANGALALAAPQRLAKQLGVEPEGDAAAILYVSRLFGVRTVVIGLDLLRPGAAQRPAVRVAPVIHASDTAAAALAGVLGEIPPRAATLLTAVSGFNTFLAFRAKGR